MPSARGLALVLLVVCLLSETLAQISFSPNWGTGKRSSPQGFEHNCWGKSDLRVLYDIVRLIQKESQNLARCLTQPQNPDDILNQ